MDPTILDLAARQHGIVTRAQLAAVGVAGHRVDYRVKTGLLTRIHRGVYRVGPVRSPWARDMAAVLACGPDAVLSHGSAAAVWEVAPPVPAEEPVHVSVSRRIRGPGPGVRLHVVTLHVSERTHRIGIRVTGVARTLLDVAAESTGLEVEAALARAEVRGLVTFDQVRATVERHAGRRGNQAVRRALHRLGGPTLTRSEAERRVLQLLRKAEVTRPRVNALVHGLEVDLTWPDHRVAVEIDGFEFHGGRPAFERDRERDAILTAAGWRVIRITWRQLVRSPEAFLVRLAGILASSL